MRTETNVKIHIKSVEKQFKRNFSIVYLKINKTFKQKKMFNLFICLSAVVALTTAADTLAAAKCRSIHATDVDAAQTAYSNNKCLLVCSIHGKLWPHNMSEGLPCPGLLGTSNICRNGQCVAPVKLGHIDIEMASASLSKKAMGNFSNLIFSAQPHFFRAHHNFYFYYSLR